MEVFVLSRVDGKRSIADIAALVGLTAGETWQLLRSLLARGQIFSLGPEHALDAEDAGSSRLGPEDLEEIDELAVEIEQRTAGAERRLCPPMDPFSLPTQPVIWIDGQPVTVAIQPAIEDDV